MRQVLRWGQSAYETDQALQLERAGAEALGMTWSHLPDERQVPDISAEVLVVTSRVRVGPEALERVRPRLVVTTTSGMDHLDLASCRARGVVVARCPMARRDAVVEHALASMLLLLRRLPQLNAASRAGRWARGDLPTLAPLGLASTPIAVVGLGIIGRRMAEVLSVMGAEVLGVDPAGGPPGVAMSSLEVAINRAQAVTLHCSLTPSSRNLLSAERLVALRPGAVVVNTSRGAVLDVEAAVSLVQKGHLGGLAVDVFPQEPYPNLQDAQSEKILFTPHSSGYTSDLGSRVAQEVTALLSAWVHDEPMPHQAV